MTYNTIMTFSNNYKRWSDDDKIFLDNYIKSNNVIDNNSIGYLSNNLKRTEMAIIYRIFKYYIENEYDFTYYNNVNIIINIYFIMKYILMNF